MIPEINVADVLRAWERLGATTHEARAAIADLLGFARARPRLAEAVARGEVAGAPATGRPAAQAARPSPSAALAVPTRLVEEPLTEQGQGLPRWFSAATALPAAGAWTPPPHEPLLDPRWARTIVSAAASVPVPLGPIDVDRLVRELARGGVIERLPRRQVRSVGAGAQLLVDTGEGMEPFAADVGDLVEEAHRVLGRERVEVHSFEGEPDGADRSPSGAEEPYAPPCAGTPVLVVSDLGLAGRGSPASVVCASWERFAARIARRRSALLAFVPYPRARWPRRMTRWMTLVEWDRRTTAQVVRAALSRAPGARR